MVCYYYYCHDSTIPNVLAGTHESVELYASLKSLFWLKSKKKNRNRIAKIVSIFRTDYLLVLVARVTQGKMKSLAYSLPK